MPSSIVTVPDGVPDELVTLTVAVVNWQTAPAGFACALLNAWPFGFYSPATVIDDSKRHKVKFLPVDILRSDWDCTLEPRAGDGAPRSGGAEYAVRIGLRYVKGLGDGDWQRIKAWRAGADTGAGSGTGARTAFAPNGYSRTSSLSGFTSVCRLPRDSMERLAEMGAFDCFDKERRDALWGVLDKGERPTNLLVGDFGETPSFRPLSAAEEVTWDYFASDQSPRGHVMEQFRSFLEKQGLPDTAAVSQMEHGRKVSMAGCAICRQMPSTASGVLFMTLEDESGFANLVVSEKVFKQYRTLILTNWMLGVTGRLQIADGVVHIIAESFWKPEFVEEGARVSASSHDFR